MYSRKKQISEKHDTIMAFQTTLSPQSEFSGGLVNSMVLALIYMCARATTMGMS